MTLLYRYFRTRGVYANIQVFREVMLRTLRGKVAPLLRRTAQGQVRDWNNPPDFVTSVGLDHLGSRASLRAEGKYAAKWFWVNNGVPGRFIRPRNRPTVSGYKRYKPALRFSVGPTRFAAVPPVLRGVLGSGAFHRSVFSMGHWWPGIRARRMDVRIYNTTVGPFRKIMENAARRAVRAAQRAGR